LEADSFGWDIYEKWVKKDWGKERGLQVDENGKIEAPKGRQPYK